ncbi:hypothetical protein V6N13_089396 [Hibiscus sabdariffa]
MSNECKDGSLSFAPTGARRFSYDGRGSQDAHKSKPKDLPRLSLDSRESSKKGSIRSMKSNFLLGDLNKSSINTNDIRSQQQESGSYEGPSSVVAKLMGLKGDPLSPSSRINENKKILISGCSSKELPSSCMINAEAKKLVYGEFDKRLAEIEFTKAGKDLGALKKILEEMQKSKQMSDAENISFEEAMRDEKWQIAMDEEIEAIDRNNTWELIDLPKGSQPIGVNILGQSSEVPNLRKLHSHSAVSASRKGTSSPTCLRSPIKIIKASKVTENGNNSTSSVVATGNLSRLRTSSHATTRYEKVNKRSDKDLTPRPSRGLSSQLHLRGKDTSRTLRLDQISIGHSPTARENPKLAVSLETSCLRLHQKKLEMEKQSCTIDLASDQSRSLKQSISLQAESGLSHQKPRHKSHNMRPSDDQLSDISSDMRELTNQGDDSSMQSESNMSMASYGDNAVTSALSYGNTDANLVEGDPKAEPPRTSLEQPSPVSVLDATFFGDESPSPVKKKSKAFEGVKSRIPNDADRSSIGLSYLPICRETGPRFKTDCRKAENIQHLVQRFMNLDSVNEIENICKSSNPDHEYIAKVMSASGLLNELDFSLAYQLHPSPSGHLINPNLFPALEQIKASNWFLNRKHSGRKVNQLDPIEKSHRQLIFDAVNEILIIKSVKKGSYKQWTFPSRREDRRQKTQQLVRDLCSEIDELQTTSNIEDKDLKIILRGDLPIGSMDWTDFPSEIPWLVLDLERLIFKDLICEVISSEVANLQQQHRSHCRRLFLR